MNQGLSEKKTLQLLSNWDYAYMIFFKQLF